MQNTRCTNHFQYEKVFSLSLIKPIITLFFYIIDNARISIGSIQKLIDALILRVYNL